METERRWTWRIVAIGFAVAAVAACALAFVFWLMSLQATNSAPRNEYSDQVIVDAVGQTVATLRMTGALSFATVFGVVSSACGILSIKE